MLGRRQNLICIMLIMKMCYICIAVEKGRRLVEGKNKELNALKIRVKQLYESHIKFRSQIQALESKGLTVSLHSTFDYTARECEPGERK